jgi:hypothetical protein
MHMMYPRPNLRSFHDPHGVAPGPCAEAPGAAVAAASAPASGAEGGGGAPASLSAFIRSSAR